MANILKMAKTHAIIGLLEQHWSYRRIARELGIHRETVARYDRLRKAKGSKPAIVTPGSSGGSGPKPAISASGSSSPELSKPAISTPGSDCGLLAELVLEESGRSSGRSSQCEPFQDSIKKMLERGLTAQRIFQDLTTEEGFTGSYSSVKRFVRRLDSVTPLPFRRMECEPGEEAQIDFGSGAWVIQEGRKRRPHVLRITLSYSRKGYSEAVYRQTTENFIRVIENAFRHFGGVPKTLVIDNLKAAVRNADWFDPDLNPKVVEFARHYGTVFLPTKPYTPRHKGKIESGVKYVKDNALKGRAFSSLQEQNHFLLEWEGKVADTRIHGTTKKQVMGMFETERATLLALPTEPFPFYEEGSRKVHRDGHVEVARAYYSVPPEYLGRQVWARWDTRLVRLFNHRFEQIAVHARVAPGRFHTHHAHIADEKISAVERGVEYLMNQVARIGTPAAAWAQAMLKARGIEGVRVLQGFLSFTRKYPVSAINEMSRIALAANLFRLRPLRELIQRHIERSTVELTEEHEIIRPLTDYGQYVSTLHGKETS